MPSKFPIKPKKQQSLKPTTLDYSKVNLPPTLPGPICVACNDTGVSSSGMPCYPCTINKRIALRPRYTPPPDLYIRTPIVSKKAPPKCAKPRNK